MSRAYISLGSNIDRDSNTRAGVAALRRAYGELALSSVYESKAVGFDGDSFYNMVIGLDTDEDVLELARHLRRIEEEHGRERNGVKFSSRTLDLDLLTYDDLVLASPGLNLPRDEILKYAFVLWPLAEIAPDAIHPQAGKSYAELWRDFDSASLDLHPIAFDFSE